VNSSTDTLAVADVLRIGACTVTLSSREVQVDGVRRIRRLTPKAVGVLRALAREPGRVVTRDELFQEVWPDTLPTNDVLTQAVTQLRKAFAADDDGALVYIETIAKTGYRLLVPVLVVEAVVLPTPGAGDVHDQSPVPAQDLPVAGGEVPRSVGPATATASRPRSRWRRWRRVVYLIIALAMVVALLVMAAMLLARRSTGDALDAAVDDGRRVVGSPKRPYRLITASGGFETYPSLSPDGSQVAYEAAAEEGDGGMIKVQTNGNAPARPLLTPSEGASDRFPRWSPDGRSIAFARFHPDGTCQVLIASATGGNVRQATRCDGTELLSFDWTPDGKALVFGSMVGRVAHRGIRVLDLASGRWQPLDYPVGADDFDYAPRYSPDGRWLVFVRNPQGGDLWRMPAAGGPIEPMTRDTAEIRGWAWQSDSRHLVFGRRVDSEVRLYRLDTQTLQLRDLGLDDAQWPTIAAHADILAFVRRRAQFGLYRIALDAPAQAQRVFASSGRDGQPMLAPDARQLVFTSDRSGSYGLWWADLQHPQSLRLIEGLRPESRQPPDWSPDSQHLLVLGRDDHGQAHVYELSPRDEQMAVLPVPAGQPLQALYTANPDHLLLLERDGNESTRLGLYDRTASPWRRLGSIEGVSQARSDSTSGKVLFTRYGAEGLWTVDARLSATSVQQINDERPSRWRYRNWTTSASGRVDYLDSSQGCATGLVRLQAGEPPQRICLDAQRLATSNGFSTSSDGTILFVALAVSDGADIGVMSLPPLPEDAAAMIGNIVISKGN